MHVERMIQRLKFYHIFDRVIPLNMTGTLNYITSVRAILSIIPVPMLKNNKMFTYSLPILSTLDSFSGGGEELLVFVCMCKYMCLCGCVHVLHITYAREVAYYLKQIVCGNANKLGIQHINLEVLKWESWGISSWGGEVTSRLLQ